MIFFDHHLLLLQFALLKSLVSYCVVRNRYRPQTDFEEDWDKLKKYFEKNWVVKNGSKVFKW